MFGGALKWLQAHTSPARLAVLGLLLVAGAAALFGSGYWTSELRLGHADQWVANSADGEIAHITGPSAEVDLRLKVADEGDLLSVTQGDEGIYVLNRSSGQLLRIDESSVTSEAAQLVSAGRAVSVLPGPDVLYVLDGAEGEALYLDPVSLAVRETHEISGGTLSGAVDEEGTLWVSQPEEGELLEIRKREVGASFSVGEPGDELRVVLDGGRPGAYNLTAGTWSAPSRQDAIDLPDLEDDEVIAAPRLGDWPVPSYTGGGSWISFSEGGSTRTRAELAPGNELGRAAITKETVFVPDLTSGRVFMVDLTSGEVIDDPEVLPEGDQMAVGARDGFGFVTQEAGRTAWVIDPSGEVAEVQLDDPDAIQRDEDGEDVTPDRVRDEESDEQSESATGVVEAPEEVDLCDVNPRAPGCSNDGDDGDDDGGGDDAPPCGDREEGQPGNCVPCPAGAINFGTGCVCEVSGFEVREGQCARIVNPCELDPQSSPSCEGYDPCKQDQTAEGCPLADCETDPQSNSGCEGYDACMADPQSSPSCPGYVDPCIADPSSSLSCANHPCNLNPQSSPSCPGYDPCIADPSSSLSCANHPCNLNPQSSPSCPGYDPCIANPADPVCLPPPSPEPGGRLGAAALQPLVTVGAAPASSNPPGSLLS